MSERSAILVLDDDESILQLVRDALSRRYQVHTAVDILEATDLISTRQFALIIADLNMPVVNGVELIRHIRAFPKFDSTPILVISAYPNLAEHLKGLRVEGFLPKPFSLAGLNAAIDALLQHSPQAPEEQKRHEASS